MICSRLTPSPRAAPKRFGDDADDNGDVDNDRDKTANKTQPLIFQRNANNCVWDSYEKNEIPVLEGELAGSAMTFAT